MPCNNENAHFDTKQEQRSGVACSSATTNQMIDSYATVEGKNPLRTPVSQDVAKENICSDALCAGSSTLDLDDSGEKNSKIGFSMSMSPTPRNEESYSVHHFPCLDTTNLSSNERDEEMHKEEQERDDGIRDDTPVISGERENTDRAREEEESEALARQLMAEEAMASYAMSAQYLRDNSDNFSSEDLAALQAAIQEEDPNGDEIEEGDINESADLSYDTMLRLGERLGDVKQERWAMNAHEHIRKLRKIVFCPSMAKGKDENDSSVKCLVCQFAYESGDSLRELPCKHVFHADCVDQWLSTKDVCPYCRQDIVRE